MYLLYITSMTWEILTFDAKETSPNPTAITLAWVTAVQVPQIIELGKKLLIDPNRFRENDTHARNFFDTLGKSRVLFIVQSHGKNIVREDIVYTLTDPASDELEQWNHRDEIDVRTLLRYISEKWKDVENIWETIMNFVNNHKIEIKDGIGDNEDVPWIVRDISSITDFLPEQEVIADKNEVLWYEYNIYDERGDLWVCANNFDLARKELPSLLLLMIETVYVLWLGPSDDDVLQIIKYPDEKAIPSLITRSTYNQFTKEIDRAIERAYPLVFRANKTPEARRKYIYEHIIKSKLDPNNIGGWKWKVEDERK